VLAARQEPRETHIFRRGDFRNPLDAVSPDVPAFLPPLPPDAPRNRLTLAKWLVDGKNPLTARVIMNRFWQAYLAAAWSRPPRTSARNVTRRRTRSCSIGWRVNSCGAAGA